MDKALKPAISASWLPIKSFVVPPNPAAAAFHPLHGSTAPQTLQPAIVVLQEWWGINKTILDHAQRIANGTGAIAVVPDLYNGKTTADEEEAKHLMNNLDWPKALESLATLAKSLQTPPAEAPIGLYKDRKVGAIGFCMGGALSLALAARMSEHRRGLNACVSFYGTPPSTLVDVSTIPESTPVQAHFGALDDHIGFSDVKTAHALADTWNLAVKRLGGEHAHGLHSLESSVFIHEGVGHGFMNEGVGEAKRHEVGGEVDKAWDRVFKFFVEHLKTV